MPGRRLPLLLVALVLIGGALLLPGSLAAKKQTGWGPAPTKCGGGIIGSSGCYGYDVGPNSMDDAGNGNIDISPHLVKVGQKLTMTVTGDSTPNWVPAPGLKPGRDCTPGARTCTFKAVSGTDGWMRYSMGFGWGAIEQDYYGVKAKDDDVFAIRGTVRKHCVLCNSVDPLPGVTVAAKGKKHASATTDSKGRYEIDVPKGEYSVVPSLADYKFQPKQRKVTVKKQNVGGVDFEGCNAGDALASSAGKKLHGETKICDLTQRFTLDWDSDRHKLVSFRWDIEYPCTSGAGQGYKRSIGVTLKASEDKIDIARNGGRYTFTIPKQGLPGSFEIQASGSVTADGGLGSVNTALFTPLSGIFSGAQVCSPVRILPSAAVPLG